MRDAFHDSGDRTVEAKLAEINYHPGRGAPYLRVIFPLECNQRVPLSPRPLTIGRSRDADLVLNNSQISRVHCQVYFTEDEVVVEDLKSTNGTFIDGRSVRRGRLSLGSRLQLGTFVLRVEFKDTQEVSYEDKLFAAATTDPLTGIANRHWLMERASAELANFSDSRHEIGAVILDIDFFKSVNDTYGHQAGDAVLRDVAQILRREKRVQDLLGRYGGEEFVMFLPFTDAERATAFCERIRRVVEGQVFTFRQARIRITVSVGVCSRPGPRVGPLEDLLQRADESLYEAKRRGRNQVVCAS